jgi:hypothetical protein
MERLFKNWVTSIIGVGIIGSAAYFLHKGHSYEMVSGWVATGMVFLRSKDSLINLPKDENKELPGDGQ